MNVYIVLDDAYDRNIICVTTDYDTATEAFNAHNEKLIADGFKPNTEQDRLYLIEEHEVIS